MLTLTWSIYILLKLTAEIGTEFEKHPLHTITLGVGISRKACLFKNIFIGDLHPDGSIIGLLVLHNYWSDSWR